MKFKTIHKKLKKIKNINSKRLEKITSAVLLFFLIFSMFSRDSQVSAWEEIIYPLKEISKLECRFEKFQDLWPECKEQLPVLNTKDYKKYAKESWGYNKYTRLYTVLWWASYEYGWDVWNWWHMWTDIATAEGTPVYSMYEWVVIHAKKWIETWNMVSIEHKINWKTVVSNYMHLSKIDVQKWQKVNTWVKIWEVWSTWNSTWNHLHFQIDFDTPYHPYYYSYDTCPYSYAKISESSICFDELKENTVDPLLFVETQWTVLNDIQIEKISKSSIDSAKSTVNTSQSNTNQDSGFDMSIFDRTVYVGYSVRDVKIVQQIFKDLWEYTWAITWDYNDIVDVVLNYQLKNNLIQDKNSTWAWRFWPKTREQVRKDYEKFLATGKKTNTGTSITSTTKQSSDFDMSIFDRTVYVGYSVKDVKIVQQIFKDLWEYTWAITWDYNDIVDVVLDYQLKNGIIQDKNSTWAWRFGPKTREQVKKDYEKFLATGEKTNTEEREKVVSNEKVVVKWNIKTQNISKKWLLTREQIEAKEVEEFLKDYNIDLKLNDLWWNIKVWETLTIKLTVTDRRWKMFKWNMPWGMTFVVDSSKVNVFPTKLYNFTDWKRDIVLKWLKDWNTTLYIKIWDKTIKSFNIKVYSEWKKIWVESGDIYMERSTVLADEKTWIVTFKDSSWKKLMNIKYEWNYKLKTNDDVEICLKQWDMTKLKNSFWKACDDYKDELNFTYNETTWWLLIFNYKTSWKNAKIDLIDNKTNKVIASKNLTVTDPKWLSSSYTYRTEVLDMLKKWLVDGINQGYFLQDRGLTQASAVDWIRNSLLVMEENAISSNVKNQISVKLKDLERERVNKFEEISRKDFLDLVYKYLVLDKSQNGISISYRDLDATENRQANTIFDKDNTWRDQFGDNYYRPKVKITRWEWAYLLSRLVQRNREVFLASR